MLLKKPLILILAIAFSVHCSNGYAQENSLSLLFVLAAGKALINNPKLFIEVSSRKGVYLGKADSQVEEESETIEWWELKQEPEANDSDGPRVCFNDDIFLTPDTRYYFFLATGVSPDSGIEAKAYSRAASDDSAYSEDSGTEDSGSSDENSDPSSEEDETDVQCVNTTPDPFRALNEISEYCATLRLKMTQLEPVYHPPADRRPRKPKLHQCDHEGCNYRTDEAHHLERHKQTHLPVDQRLRIFHCNNEGCDYITDQGSHLKRHKRTHLPVGQRPRVYQCDNEGCDYSTDLACNLKRHKQTHLPIDQRLRVHHCDHEGCNYNTDVVSNLKTHKQTHLAADQRVRMHQCHHKGCDYSTDRVSHLKRHKQTHLPANQRLWLFRCDHEGCNYNTDYAGNLKRHKHNHLPAGQRAKRKVYDQPSSDKKRKKDDKE
ncbi:C2H2-type zinc finger protein [Endozoicomonas sp. 4G]|uniref:C2H2-type zinc finger protein n=1 Tax=Endozoicomonas sp. 4G TaxID=2872754 RepID=UPI0020791600|nr:C2H2-type zinc finger protein [Endozoicomonas sp. 4G]